MARWSVTYFLAASLLCFHASLRAQESTATELAPQRASAPEKVILSEGTPIHLKLAQSLSSKAAVIGEPVELVLSEDVKVGDALVVKRGARVLGTLVAGKESEKRGVAKEIKVRLDLMKAGDTRIKLRGEQSASGKRAKGDVVAASIFFGVSGYLWASSPKNVILPEGTPVDSFADESIELPVIQ